MINDKDPSFNGKRFSVRLITARGVVHNNLCTDVVDKAMRDFVALTKTDFGSQHSPGAHVALMDQNHELDAAKVYEGHGCYRMQFAKSAGQEAFNRLSS